MLFLLEHFEYLPCSCNLAPHCRLLETAKSSKYQITQSFVIPRYMTKMRYHLKQHANLFSKCHPYLDKR